MLCRRNLLRIFAIVCLLSCFIQAKAQLNSAVVRPGAVWKDTQGDEIEAHGGGVIRYSGEFFWFGEDRSPGEDSSKRYVSCYASGDLVHWTKRGDALTLADPEHLGPRWVLERPKVYYNTRAIAFEIPLNQG